MHLRPTARAASAGSMTSVMRSVTPIDAPRSLRIGVVADGQVIEERLWSNATTITIGSGEANTFVVAPSDGPASFPLFRPERVAGVYRLHLAPGMTARVAMNGEAQVFDGSDASHAVANGEGVRLTPDARGSVRLGTRSVVFQMVASPPHPARPQLPLSVKNSFWSDVDWSVTVIASFSFLMHFGGVGMLYSDWMDPEVIDAGITASLVDEVASLPQVPLPIESPRDPIVGPNEPSAPPDPGPAPGPRTTRAPAGYEGQPGTPPSARIADSAARELDRINVDVLSVLTDGREASATRDVLRSGSEIPTGPLEKLASRDGSISSSQDMLGIETGASAMHPGEVNQGGGLAAIGNTRRTTPIAAGPAPTVAGPVLKPIVTAPPKVTGGVPGAPNVIAGLTGGFRRCYMLGLNDMPDMKGSVRVTASIGPNGEVLSVSAVPSGTVTGSVASCIAARVRGAQFSPPEGGMATVVIPVTLTQQKSR